MDEILKCKVTKIEENKKYVVDELLVYEYPLTILLNQKKIKTLLCTPENMKELAFGFLRTEEFIRNFDEITDVKLDQSRGIVEIETREKVVRKDDHYEFSNFFDSINCKLVESDIVLESKKIHYFMKKNLTYSEVFKKTGGVHSVALCNKEDVLFICEDVARHNAMDKVIGKSFIEGIDLKDKIIVLSGRVSLEMILKATKMQIPIIISKSAPTNLSVELAKKLNITLVGFVRGGKMNIYANEYRIKWKVG